MSTISIKFRQNQFQLVTDNPERVSSVAERVNQRIDNISKASSNATDTKLAFMAALMLEDELDTLQDNLAKSVTSPSTNHAEKLLTETLVQVADYINQLANKLV
jgi:cell division protein ZapA (FtsZ GTPase activity inhibitor)